ncbi:homeodomain transcription factor [Mycena polygramma]|nr:homeodomain transcription factor [Mycena polygramma]
MPPLKSAPPKDKLKKPRHRHSAVQLAALNSLYEQTEHPTLAQRTELAQSLGLETKSVNAYFQNKRASSKKQPRGSPYDAPGRAPSHPLPWSSAVDDDYYYPPPHQYLRSTQLLDQDPRPRNQLTPSDHPQYLRESAMDGGAPSRRQIDELQHIYRINPYPTLDETSTIAERIGMRHQSIVEWFRTQRSLDRRDAYPIPPSDLLSPMAEASERQSRPYPILPPISTLPLPLPLALPPATVHPSLVGARRLSAVSEDHYYAAPRRSSSPRNATPYGASSSSSSTALSLSARQRRGRPDPLQLISLRRLLSKTPTPSIEERSALAREIGMDLGKVTNWFRNLRQSARKREKKGRGARGGTSDGEDGDEAEYNDSEPVYLSSTSRSSETPSDEYSRGRRARALHSSDEEEDAQEAVTPASSPSPPPSPSRGRPPDFNLGHLDMDEKAVARFSGRVPYEDALLLLSFHRRAGMF